MTEALELRRPAAGLTFTPEQQKMIREMYAPGSSESEFRALIAIAEARNLNPLLKQVYFVKRWDSQSKTEKWAVQGSIDGLRAIAQRTNLYDGQDEPEFEYDPKGGIRLAKVRVYRKDWHRPAVGVAHWSEYAQTKKDGGLTSFWANKPHVMLAKCAEALALRKAFPEDTGGLYVPEELPEEERAAAARDVTPSRSAPIRGVVPDDAPPAPEAKPPVEPPHDPVTGEVLPANPAVAADAMTPEQINIFDGLLNNCGDGFNAQQHKENWLAKHTPEIAALPKFARDELRKAYEKASTDAKEKETK